MPIIEFKYECKCGHKGISDSFVALSEVSEEGAVRCENCGLKQKGTRVWNSVPAIKFVGPGFHVNDYPKEKSPEKK